MTDKKKLEAIIADIQSSDLKLAKSGIEKFRKVGQSDAIPEFAIAITQNENPEILNSKDTYKTMKIMKDYYERKNEISEIDDKLFSIIHPRIKKILEEI